MMDDMKQKMEGVDFAGLSEKFAAIFGAAGGGMDGFPKLPEKFMKGQIARLAEDIIKEFDIKEFGIDPEMMKAAGNDPSKALGMITDLLTKNPQALQGIIQKLTKKIQKKIQSGSLKPQELVAEAEELMKTFSENPQFVSLMESFRQSFGNVAQGRQEHPNDTHASGRLSLVQQRLRKKLEQRKKDAEKK
jgi:ABC-type nitrate/sulfonate/bicarbonate transport system substrate-binding protein